MPKEHPPSKPSGTDVSKGGSRILRHDAPSDQEGPAPAMLTEKEMAAIEAFYKSTIGDYSSVFHEIFSPDIHVDVIAIPPSGDTKWWTVTTMGMSAAPMSAPRGRPKFAELAMQLPSNWKFDEKSLAMEDGRYSWPIEWIKTLARLPITFDTHVDICHTVPMEDIAPAKACTFACAMFLPFMGADPEKTTIIAGRKSIQLYSVVPLYQEEIDLHLEQGFDVLAELMEAAELQPWDMSTPGRRNVAKPGK